MEQRACNFDEYLEKLRQRADIQNDYSEKHREYSHPTKPFEFKGKKEKYAERLNDYYINRDKSKKNKKGKYTTLHPTQKPENVYKHLITVSSNINDLVCDPFAGTGTANVVCHNLERYCIGIEKNEKFIQSARERLKSAKPNIKKSGIDKWT